VQTGQLLHYLPHLNASALIDELIALKDLQFEKTDTPTILRIGTFTLTRFIQLSKQLFPKFVTLGKFASVREVHLVNV
jgi:hypothetical protein